MVQPCLLMVKAPKNHVVRLRVSQEERNYLEEEAARTDRSVSSVLRLALRQYVERQETAR